MLWLPLIFFFFLLIDMKMSAQNKKNKTRLLYNVNEPDASISIQMIHAFLCIFKKKNNFTNHKWSNACTHSITTGEPRMQTKKQQFIQYHSSAT